MSAAAVVLVVIVVLIVLALVYYLVSVIFELRKITKGLDTTIAAVVEIIEKSEPVNAIVADINGNLDAAVDALEGLLVKKAGLPDTMGLLEGLYPGAKAAGLRNFPDSAPARSPRTSQVYTRGTPTLARLGREAPIAVASPNGPALRDARYGSTASRGLYPAARPPRSPVIGTNAPVQYEAEDADPSTV